MQQIYYVDTFKNECNLLAIKINLNFLDSKGLQTWMNSSADANS